MFLYDDKFTGNGTIAPSSAPIPATRNENSLIILSWAIFSVGMLVFAIFLWNVRNQIKELVIKVRIIVLLSLLLVTLIAIFVSNEIFIYFFNLESAGQQFEVEKDSPITRVPPV
jgi:hypothetical protein